MKISINKDSAVPIRDQLIEQLGLQIASGTLAAHEKLPSIRALADRLGVHYSTITAAYNHLADVGLLEVRQGSGVRVASIGRKSEAENSLLSLEEMFQDFLARASERGYSAADVSSCLGQMSQRSKIERILAVDANKDFHKVIVGELKPHFSIPVETITPTELLEAPQHMEKSLVVASLYHLFSFQRYVKDLTRLVACNIEPARAEMDAVAAMPKSSLVVLVSVSTTLLHMASNLVAAVRGEDLAVRSIERDDDKELKYIVKHADLFVCDSLSEEKLAAMVPANKLKVFKLYPPSTIERIKDRIAKWG